MVPITATAGSRYNEAVSVSADCGGSPFTRAIPMTELTVQPPTTGECAISGSAKSPSHLEVSTGQQFTYLSSNLYNSGSE